MRNIPSLWIKISGVVREFQVEVGNIDMRFVPINECNPVCSNQYIAWVGITVDRTGFSTDEPRPRCPATGNGQRPRQALA